MSIYKVLGALEKWAHAVTNVESLQHAISKERQDRMTNLVQANVSNTHWKAASHLFTGAISLIAGTAATRIGVDASSAITISSKVGETGTTWIGSWEAQTQGDQRKTEHQLSKGSETARRYTEFFQQFMRNVEAMSQLRSKVRLGS